MKRTIQDLESANEPPSLHSPTTGSSCSGHRQTQRARRQLRQSPNHSPDPSYRAKVSLSSLLRPPAVASNDSDDVRLLVKRQKNRDTKVSAVLDLEQCFAKQLELKKSEPQQRSDLVLTACPITGLSMSRAVKPHQADILFWIERQPGGLICAEMGLGKTMIGLLALFRDLGPGLVSLVVAPSDTSCGDWVREAVQMFGEQVKYSTNSANHNHRDHNRIVEYSRLSKLGVHPDTWSRLVVVVTYDELITIIDNINQELKDEPAQPEPQPQPLEPRPQDVDLLMIKTMFARDYVYVFADECQKIGNPKTKWFKAMQRLKAKKKFGLSGTPLSNTVEDVRSQLSWTLSPGLVSRLGDKQLADYMYIVDYKMAQVQMPEKHEQLVLLEFPPEVRAIYSSVENSRQILPIVKSTIKRQICLAACLAERSLTKYSLVSCPEQKRWLDSLDSTAGLRSPKLCYLADKIQDICVKLGRQLFVVCSFAEALSLAIQVVPKHLTADVLCDTVPKKERRDIVASFKAGKLRVLFTTYKLGAEGHNFQNCNHVLMLDNWWTDSANSQAQARSFRFGQTQDVQVTKLQIKNSVDQRVADIADGKGQQQRRLFRGRAKK